MPTFESVEIPAFLQRRYDYFISYSHHDVAWARWVKHQLELAGKRVLLQDEHFVPGTNFILQMHEAVQASSRILAILSRHFLASAFTQPEWAYGLLSDPRGWGRRLIPIRVDDVEPIGLLAPIVYVDLLGVAPRQAKIRLLRATVGSASSDRELLAKHRGKAGPPFPSTVRRTSAPIGPDRQVRDQEVAEGKKILDSAIVSACQLPSDRPASLLIFDIDKMTEINRVHSVDLGSRVISEVRNLIVSAIPETAICKRCGEDSYFALLEANSEQALLHASRAVSAVALRDWTQTFAPGLWVTVRAGVAQCSPKEHPNLTILRAMSALHNAGRGGGNSVQIAPFFAGNLNVQQFDELLRKLPSQIWDFAAS